MSVWANVGLICKCPSRQMSVLANVRLGKCLSRQMLILANVHLSNLGKCPSREMSVSGNVPLGKCPSWQIKDVKECSLFSMFCIFRTLKMTSHYRHISIC